jgi:SpoIID/LytB domain protein
MKRWLAAAVAAGTALAGVAWAPASPVADASGLPPTLTIVGHGWGHGRGMGQYGAYGYALAGESYRWILGHYYGATTPTTVSTSTVIPVDLSELNGQSTATVLDSKSSTVVTVHAGQIFTPPSGVALVHGPWPEGPWRAFQGRIQVLANPARTVALEPVEDYVQGVVPAESPASWGIHGEAALQAQAVAARTYALAYLRSSSTICDNPACQMFVGDPNVAANPYHVDVSYSDLAESTTSGQVLDQAGAPAFTEYSSSTGGYTAGGDFPAVVDAGDATPSNPNHTWSVGLPTSEVQAIYGPAVGTVRSVIVTKRNGLGDLGGRVLQVAIGGTAGSTIVSGVAFADGLGLRSDWFAITDTSGPSGGTNGYWVVAANAGVYAFGNAPNYGSMAGHPLNQPVVGMAPTADNAGYWEVASDGGVFDFGDARFYGSTGNIRLNRPVIGMASSPTSKGYWLYAGDGGVFEFGDAHFYGSTGNIRLNQPVVGMASTADGHGYWLVASDGGVFEFGDAHFYGSTGNIRLNQPVVGMVPTRDGHGYWLVGRDGGIFEFGDAAFLGSLPGRGISDTIVSVTPTADGGGYLMVSAAGRIYNFGDAPYYGDPATTLRGWSSTALQIFSHKS